jgi:PTH1 family peptidyl-tRNA hydrolase
MISLILGLGNVGRRYQDTRHNTGFVALDKAAGIANIKTFSQFEHGRKAEAVVDGERITLAWPATLMNQSGLAAGALLEQLDLEPEHMLVISDDVNLPLGTLRFRTGGSDGGHNGLYSIIDSLGTQAFPRLRLGIGPLPEGADLTEFVLGRFSEEEVPAVKRMVAIAAEAVIFAVTHHLQEVMSRYNINPALPE